MARPEKEADRIQQCLWWVPADEGTCWARAQMLLMQENLMRPKSFNDAARETEISLCAINTAQFPAFTSRQCCLLGQGRRSASPLLPSIHLHSFLKGKSWKPLILLRCHTLLAGTTWVWSWSCWCSLEMLSNNTMTCWQWHNRKLE